MPSHKNRLNKTEGSSFQRPGLRLSKLRYRVHPRYTNPNYVDWQPNPKIPNVPFGRRPPNLPGLPGLGRGGVAISGRMLGRLIPWVGPALLAYDIYRMYQGQSRTANPPLDGYALVWQCSGVTAMWTNLAGFTNPPGNCADVTVFGNQRYISLPRPPNIWSWGASTIAGCLPPIPNCHLYMSKGQQWTRTVVNGKDQRGTQYVPPNPAPKRRFRPPTVQPYMPPFIDPRPDPQPEPAEPIPVPLQPFTPNPDRPTDPAPAVKPMPPRFTSPYRTNPGGWPQFREAGNEDPWTTPPRRPDFLVPPVVVSIDVPQDGTEPGTGPGQPGPGPGTRPTNPEVRPDIKHPTGWPPARKPPPKGEKERKVRATTGAMRVIGGALGGLSEANDLVDSLWRALPKKYRTGRNFAQRARDVFEHLDSIDVGDALGNFVLNEIEDRLVGRAIGYGNKIRPGLASDMMRF